ncbi:single-stranded-DNA-specific exonuclease RecJ [Clostridium sp. MSJ-4]|uniref:Single-stranded-DNA-specific exonuclease RecJ n=1 Tax=Clostridium simiarum TaxID=2841506 RepID=A0ABS6EY41_9CLOT|nr:single-stranded-DNA-specific exonuclease RecJ [Clostridium simiarum]MBU5591132.1 single-stranded-DNA-specific exonuclease RecJ [Clostridium simiarum]
MKKWYIKNKKIDYKIISQRFGISEIISKLLVNRDIVEDNLLKNFIHPSLENLHNPRLMQDLEKAAQIIKDKISSKDKIRIIGDYDVDGVISSYILFESLKRCGADVDYEIPDRIKDGYGINIDIVNKSKEDGIDTIITCDNGISAIDPIKHAKDLGITVIVTDHHNIPFVENESGNRVFISSKADAIINPKQDKCKYKFKSLCGAGVVFKLIEVLYEELEIDKKECYKFIEFVAIATVCDVVDLVDENRIFVKNGIEMLNKTENIGLKALIKETGIENKTISTYHLGFVIGPCINASGRLDNAKKGLRLLITKDEKEANILAKELYELNQQRKDMTQKGVEKAIELVETTDIRKDKVFVIHIPEVHESLAGIVAGRIREKYNVPTIIVTKSEDKSKGSGRSIEGYDMFEELLKCKSLLDRFGGHPMAAGLSLETYNIEPLRRKLNELTELTEEDLTPKVNLDMQLPLDCVNYDLIQDLRTLEPFGKANPKPLFGEKNIRLIRGSILGQNRNVLKLKLLTRNGSCIDGIYFGDIEEFEKVVIDKYGADELDRLYQGKNNNINLDIAFYPDINEYNGNISIQLVIENFR